jgi:histidine triad (HIT) family protein
MRLPCDVAPSHLQKCEFYDFRNHLQPQTGKHFKEDPMPTIFSKIIDGQIRADIVYKDEQATAFRDIEPQAPVHILIVPNKEIPTVNDVTPDDEQLIGHMFTVAKRIAEQEGVAESGYRLLVNCNRDAGQEVFHLHMHLFAGRRLGPMVMKK